MIKVKTIIYENLPIICAILIFLSSFAYTNLQLNSKRENLEQKNKESIKDFCLALKTRITDQIHIVEILMLEEWLDINNVSQLYNYTRFLSVVQTFYNFSSSFLAINWINSTGNIIWVYPYEKNISTINKSIVYYKLGNKSVINEAFLTAKYENRTAISQFSDNLLQGGQGFSAIIPIIYKNSTYGYFNLVFEINDILKNIINSESSLNDFSYKIVDENIDISEVNEDFSIKNSFVIFQEVNFYNAIWFVYIRPSRDLIYQTTLISEFNIILAEVFLCLLTYFLTDRLKNKNTIIEKDHEEKKEILNQVYRKENMNVLGTIASEIAHDINNITTNIMGHIELIKENIALLNKYDENENDNIALKNTNYSLNAIERNLKRSKDITREILIYSKKDIQTYEILEITDVINESLKLVVETSDKRIRFKFAPKGNYFVYANRTKLFQIFMNVLLNSINAIIDHNNALIEINYHRDNLIFDKNLIKNIDNLDQNVKFFNFGLVISFKDNGKGIDQERINKLFDIFYYNSQNTKKGTGLGLGIIYNNVISLGGTFSINSELKKYTEVIIKLPLVIPEDHQEKFGELDQLESDNIKPLKTNDLFLLESKNVLIIDNEVDIIKTYSTLLKQYKINVTGFTKGIPALKYYQTHTNLDVIIIDTNLSDINGFELIKQLIAYNDNMKIIILSSDLKEKTIFPNLDILLKPFSIHDLIGKLGQNFSNN